MGLRQLDLETHRNWMIGIWDEFNVNLVYQFHA